LVFAAAADTLRKFCEKSKGYTVAPSPSLSPEALVIGEAAIAGGSHMRASLILAIIGVVSCSTVGHSQTLDERVARQVLEALEGTISVEAKPQFAEGQLFGCTVEFNAIERDWIYKQGAHIRIAGGFALIYAQKKLGVTLKVILHDIDLRTLNYTPSPPTSAYFVSGNSTTKSAVVGSYPSDVPGAIFVVLQMNPTFKIITEDLTRGKLAIAFARTKGGSDIQVTIDTNVVETSNNGQRTRSPKAALDFLDCSNSLLQSVSE
jgi:hypothetical protein